MSRHSLRSRFSIYASAHPDVTIVGVAFFSAAELNGLLLGGVPPKFLRSLLRDGLDRDAWLQSPPREREVLAWRSIGPVDPGCETAVLGSPEYPWVFSALSAPPVLLYYQGSLDRLLPGIGVCGSRNASAVGLGAARVAAEVAATVGAPLVSGLAAGVDEAAHRAALEFGGFTVGFLGCALEQVAGRSADLVGDVLASDGLVVSEVPPGVGANPNNLLARNRLVVACSYPLLLAEAALPSGSLAAARDAFMQGVPLVVALPPPSLRRHPNAAGVLPLAGLADWSTLGWPARLFDDATPRVRVANAVAESGSDLREFLRVLYAFRPSGIGDLTRRSPRPLRAESF